MKKIIMILLVVLAVLGLVNCDLNVLYEGTVYLSIHNDTDEQIYISFSNAPMDIVEYSGNNSTYIQPYETYSWTIDWEFELARDEENSVLFDIYVDWVRGGQCDADDGESVSITWTGYGFNY